MRNDRRIISLILCFAMLLGAFGCAKEVPQETVPTTAAPDAAGVYAQAASAAQALTAFALTQSTDLSVTANGETFASKEAQTISCNNWGQEGMSATVEATLSYNDTEAKISESYLDGTVYVQSEELSFRVEMLPEDYIARFLPAVLLDSSLYSNISYREGSTETVVFSSPSSAEAWLQLPEGALLLEAQGIAVLDNAGNLLSTQYSCSYAITGVTYHLTATQQISREAVAAPTVPEGADNWSTMDHPDIPKLILQAEGYLLNTVSISSTYNELISSQPTAMVIAQRSILDAYGENADLQAKSEHTVQIYAPNQQTENTMEERFQNGVYTAAVDNGTPQESDHVTADIFRAFISDFLVKYLPDPTAFTGAEITDLGGLLLLEFTYTDEFALENEKELSEKFFEDPDFLDNLASSYETLSCEGYLGFDKYSGLPTASGFRFSCQHVIDGSLYETTLQRDQSFYLSSTDSYFSITETPVPDKEPEEKPTPLFYKVTGQDGQQMWLFGTIHLGDDRTGYLPQALMDAFNTSDALAVECDTQAFDKEAETNEAIQALISELYFYDEGTIGEHLEDQELYEYALKLMKATGNYNSNTEHFRPYVWATILEQYCLQQGYQLVSEKGVDNRLLDAAQASDKKIYEVESNEFQMKMQAGWSAPLQELLLEDACASDYIEYCSSVMELYEAWCRGDEAELSRMINEDDAVDTSSFTEEELAEYEAAKPLLEEYNKALGPDRNDDMLRVAIGYLESGETVFYAVGLAHLLAPDGLVNTLREAGYTVELVPFS